MAKKLLIGACSFLDLLHVNSFVILATEKSFWNSSLSLFFCSLSNFFTQSSLPVCESSA